MSRSRYTLLLVFAFLASPALWGQATESSISKQLQALSMAGGPPMRGGMPGGQGSAGMSDAQRPATIIQIAKDIDSLRAGLSKVKLADSLAVAAGQGEVGKEALQAAGDTLAKAVAESPQPEKNGVPAPPYMELAELARYAGVATSLKDPELEKASQIVLANEADVAKADFTLKALDGKKVTLSALRGKIVLVSFWATECIPCRKEMQDLDLIYTHYQQQGLEILSITDENPFSVNQSLSRIKYHPTVLFDDGRKVGKAFHVEDLPKTFVFDRNGKLVGESLGMCTQRQFFAMLGAAGLQPER